MLTARAVMKRQILGILIMDISLNFVGKQTSTVEE
jgi:hypothetical protein